MMDERRTQAISLRHVTENSFSIVHCRPNQSGHSFADILPKLVHSHSGMTDSRATKMFTNLSEGSLARQFLEYYSSAASSSVITALDLFTAESHAEGEK